MSIYMKIPNVEGSVTHDGYEGWIQLDAVNFGGATNPNSNINSDRYSQTKTPSRHDITMSKQLDNSSGSLMLAAHVGTAYDRAEIHYMSNLSNLIPQVSIELLQPVIYHYSHVTTDDNTPLEFLIWRYYGIRNIVSPLDERGRPESPHIFSYP